MRIKDADKTVMFSRSIEGFITGKGKYFLSTQGAL